MKKLIATILLMLLSTNAFSAGWILIGGTVTHVGSTWNNLKQFQVYTEGGTGACVGQWLQFPLSDAGDIDVHRRAYAQILMAIATGMTVNIYSYTDDSCVHAAFVELVK